MDKQHRSAKLGLAKVALQAQNFTVGWTKSRKAD
jgi:hypothetical protein